jgi:PAS domain S-box-containing protein
MRSQPPVHSPDPIPWAQCILNNVLDAVIITGPDLRVIKYNAAFEQLFHNDTKTHVGENLIELLHLLYCDSCGISQRLQQLVNKGDSEENILFILPEGKILKLSCYTNKLAVINNLSSVIVVIHEVQNQIHAAHGKTGFEEKVNESVLYAFLDNSLGLAWIAEEDGHLLFINKFARQIWGLDDTYRFKHMYELLPKTIADEFLASNTLVLNTNQPLAFVVPSIRKDGSPGFYMLHKFLLPLNTSKRYVVGQAIDITEEINMREELRKSNERFSYVAKAVEDCIWDWDIETGKIYRSDALMALTGYSAEAIENSEEWWMEKIHPNDQYSVKNKLDAFIKQGYPYCDIEYRFRCANNRYKYFLAKGYIAYRDNKPVRAIGVVHDITEKKKMGAKLLRQKIQKQQEISQAIIAAQDLVCNELGKELHDNVNQILASANLLLEYLLSNERWNKDEFLDKSCQYVKLAIEEIRRISKTLNTSLIAEVGLIKPIEEIIANMKLNLPIKIKFECDPALEQQLSSEQKLMIYRIIQEQTNNISKYADASKVLITIKIKINSLHLAIQDNGKGFELGQIKRGVGLTNIRNRVEANKGSLHITTSPGKGCKIELMVSLNQAK